eukprot:13866936-Alexandrium_andersonii.AAC.1
MSRMGLAAGGGRGVPRAGRVATWSAPSAAPGAPAGSSGPPEPARPASTAGAAPGAAASPGRASCSDGG